MKFAKIDFINSFDEIPIHFNLYKKEKILKWYINKFNPYIKEEKILLNQKGYNIKLPILIDDAYQDKEILFDIFNRTMYSIKQLDVEIISKPYDFIYKTNEIIKETNKKSLMSIFMIQIIEKAIEILNKELKDVNIVIIDGNKLLTTNIIKSIYTNVNYLSVMSENDFEDLIQYVFEDNGLNIATFKNNNSIISNGDIIINLNDNDFEYYHSLKSGCVFIDLTNNIKSILNICIKREDVLVIDNINIGIEKEVLSLDEFELFYYTKSNLYRSFLRGNHSEKIINQIKKELMSLSVDINDFCRLNKKLDSNYFLTLQKKIKKTL